MFRVSIFRPDSFLATCRRPIALISLASRLLIEANDAGQREEVDGSQESGNDPYEAFLLVSFQGILRFVLKAPVDSLRTNVIQVCESNP